MQRLGPDMFGLSNIKTLKSYSSSSQSVYASALRETSLEKFANYQNRTVFRSARWSTRQDLVQTKRNCHNDCRESQKLRDLDLLDILEIKRQNNTE